MTLPLIYTLQRADEATKRKIIYIVKNQNKDKQKVNEVIELVKKSGGIEYAREKMLQYQKEAMEILYRFPESESRTAMEELVHYVTERRY